VRFEVIPMPAMSATWSSPRPTTATFWHSCESCRNDGARLSRAAKPTEEPREARILDAALKVFAEAGYSGATMDAVAAEAGITKPTLYQYFASKEALFQAMMLGHRDRMLVAFAHPSGNGMVAGTSRLLPGPTPTR
jgi:methylphosphotriester-DNA--protein-cysteine methyltransferase